MLALLPMHITELAVLAVITGSVTTDIDCVAVFVQPVAAVPVTV
jgi:hypothetical protein